MSFFLDTRMAITQLIFASNTPECVDLVIVVGCESLTNMDPAIDLYQREMTKAIVITGRGPTTRREPEWQRYQEYAIAKGIPASAMLIEPEARNTRENFLFSEVLIASRMGWSNVNKIAISAQPAHTRRARMTALGLFPAHIEVMMLSPSDASLVQPHNWWKTRYGRQTVLDELRRIGEYGLREQLGDI